MLTNKGFTLIETLFVLMIICILSSLSMNLHMPRKSEEVSLAEIESFIREAQFIAMNQKVTNYFCKFFFPSDNLSWIRSWRVLSIAWKLIFWNTYINFQWNGAYQRGKDIDISCSIKELSFCFSNWKRGFLCSINVAQH